MGRLLGVESPGKYNREIPHSGEGAPSLSGTGNEFPNKIMEPRFLTEKFLIRVRGHRRSGTGNEFPQTQILLDGVPPG